MKSNKQRREELKAKRAAKRAAEKKRLTTERAAWLKAHFGHVDVDRDALTPHGSYSEPDFVTRGFYVDTAFDCQSCGKAQVWTATRQKWWYEVAKGNVFTTARFCRECRQRERARREEARRVQAEGVERKRRERNPLGD